MLRNNVFRRICYGLLILLCSILLMREAFYQGWVRFNYPSSQRWPVQGIDVSHHQKNIDWTQLGKQNIQFAFIKATEGGDFKDPLFATHWQQSRASGLMVGAYHFFRFCRPGALQAQNFIETVPVTPDALPPVIDLEYGANCAAGDTQALRENIQQMIAPLEAAYGKKVILYATSEFYDDVLHHQFNDNPIWIRNIWRQPQLEDGREWHFWQFANRGRLDGIAGHVDLNVFYGSLSGLQQLRNPTPHRPIN